MFRARNIWSIRKGSLAAAARSSCVQGKGRWDTFRARNISPVPQGVLYQRPYGLTVAQSLEVIDLMASG